MSMAWVAVNMYGEEYIFNAQPFRGKYLWACTKRGFQLPQGSIKKLIGRELTWNDEPVELK